MAEAQLTVFQKVENDICAWEDQGGIGTPPARYIFRSRPHGVTALVDPFAKLPDTVVVVPHEGTPGKDAYFNELRPSRLLKVTLVAQQVGRKIVEVTGLRDIWHVEGYGVPDHSHLVQFPARRREGAALYQDNIERPTQAQLDATLGKLAIVGEERARLIGQLDAVDRIADEIDNDSLGLPLGGLVETS